MFKYIWIIMLVMLILAFVMYIAYTIYRCKPIRTSDCDLPSFLWLWIKEWECQHGELFVITIILIIVGLVALFLASLFVYLET